MEFIPFEGVNMVLGEGQEEYIPLPVQAGVLKLALPDGGEIDVIAMTCCAKLSPEELEQVQRDGFVFVTQLTFGRQLQPIHGTFLRPDMREIPQPKPDPAAN